MLSRTIFAAQISMQVALVAVGVGLVGGTVIGVVAAYFGGWVDLVLMRLMELLFSFPAILLAVILMASLGTSDPQRDDRHRHHLRPRLRAPGPRLDQGVLRQQLYRRRPLPRHGRPPDHGREILPNIVAPSLVEAAVAFAYAVLLESALSFLGLGAQPPEPSWGNMLNTGRGFMEQAPWLGIVPGLAMFLCVLGFNLLGDGLRDLLDPHLRE